MNHHSSGFQNVDTSQHANRENRSEVESLEAARRRHLHRADGSGNPPTKLP